MEALDKELFIFINQTIQNGFFDFLMPYLREKLTWVPFYLLLGVLLIWKYGMKGLWVIIFTVIAFGLCDFISSSIVKPYFDRLRPCNDPVFSEQVRLLITCGPGKSFTSSHATNHMGMAVFIILIFYKRYKWILPVALLWALSVGFAQIYVGVHYPADILGGALLGSIIAFLVFLLYKKISHRFAFNLQP